MESIKSIRFCLAYFGDESAVLKKDLPGDYFRKSDNASELYNFMLYYTFDKDKNIICYKIDIDKPEYYKYKTVEFVNDACHFIYERGDFKDGGKNFNFFERGGTFIDNSKGRVPKAPLHVFDNPSNLRGELKKLVNMNYEEIVKDIPKKYKLQHELDIAFNDFKSKIF